MELCSPKSFKDQSKVQNLSKLEKDINPEP